MKRIIMMLCVAFAISLGDATVPNVNSALADTLANSEQPAEIVPTKPLAKRELKEINFTVRTFLWALDQKQENVLAKVAAPQMRAEFPGPTAMLMVMRRVHAPVIGARHVFLHLPTFKNGFVLQTVYLDDIKGNPWKATYMLKRGNNGRFGIFGCVVRKLAGEFS